MVQQKHDAAFQALRVTELENRIAEQARKAELMEHMQTLEQRRSRSVVEYLPPPPENKNVFSRNK